MALLSTLLNLEPSYLTQLCIYTGATYREEIMHLFNNILKVMNFLKNSHFALFVSFDIHAKNTNFTFGIPHTHIYRYTHRHIQIPFFTFCTFWLIWYTCQNIFGILQTYTCTDTQTYVQRHWHTDTDTLRHMQVCKHMHVCIHTQTHTPMFMWGI